jgi:circadian clock protein KaiB
MKRGAAKRPGKRGRPATPVYLLRLYVAGQSPRSMAALDNLRRLCETHLDGCCRVEVVDLLEHPDRARRDQILAIPTLVRVSPLPLRRLVGDLSEGERVLAVLELRPVR